jgi:uncharacterized membrane protein SirB2
MIIDLTGIFTWNTRTAIPTPIDALLIIILYSVLMYFAVEKKNKIKKNKNIMFIIYLNRRKSCSVL